tara:strand:+ start:4114 stop:7980 length:3867 start_codon:yes stop_codon:yes gene_type:complete
MAKKTHSLKAFTLGYNSKVAPRDLKDDALAKSQGVTPERPGTLSLLGKANHLFDDAEFNYSYKNMDATNSSVLGEQRNPVQDPGSGVFSFTSEYSFGYVGLISAIAAEASTPNPHIQITPDASTPIKEGTGNSITDAIPIKEGDWIYIWGISNLTGMHDLNDRHFKVKDVNDNGTFQLCNYFYGKNQILDSSKFSTLASYNSATHGGYFKTIPEVNYTRYIVTQNGECLDLHYDVLGSQNIFSKGTIPVGTLGTLSSKSGLIGLEGDNDSLDLGQANNFEYWPQANGINYAIKPSFFFSDNTLRYWASNRIMRNSDGDTNQHSNPRWFGYLHRQNLFGLDSSVTNINEWYLTDANIRPPTRGRNNTVNHFGNYTADTIEDRVSWETGAITYGEDKWTRNKTWADTKRFTESVTTGSGWHNMSGVVHMRKGELRDDHCSLEGMQNLARRRGWARDGGGDPISPLAMFNHLPDGSMRISQADYGEVATSTTLEYWHDPDEAGGDSYSPTSDYVSTTGSNTWTWNPQALATDDKDGIRNGSITKAAGNQNPLYFSRGTNDTTYELYGQTYILKFTLNDCTAGHGLKVRIQGGTEVTVDTSSSKEDYYNISLNLDINEDADTHNYLIKFTPTNDDWVGTISNVSLAKRYFKDNTVVCLFSTSDYIESDTDSAGWIDAKYEFYQTFLFDTPGDGIQESCATYLYSANTIGFETARRLKFSPAVNFSSDGFHYDMMDKRITGSNIYYRKTKSESSNTETENISLLLEMDWKKGCRQWGAGSGDWVPWTQSYIGTESDYALAYTVDGENLTLDLSQTENSKVMPQYSDATKPFFEWIDPPLTTPSYSNMSNNGHKYNEPGMGNIRYGTMASVGGRKYVGNFAIPSNLTSTTHRDDEFRPAYDYYPTSIIRSSGGKSDMYCVDTDILRLSGISESRIVKMYGLSKYLIVLCLDSYYILDMSQSVPLVFANNAGQGIKHECQSIKTDMGIVWVNDKGCFLFGGTEQGYGVKNLIEGKISKDKRGWVNNNEKSQFYDWDESFSNTPRPNRKGLYYWDITDENEYVPSVGYDGENRKIIIKKSCKYVKDNDASHIYVYDAYTGSWTTNINGTEDDSQGVDDEGVDDTYDSSKHYSFAPLKDSSAYTSNFATLSDGEIIYHVNDSTSKVYKWHNSPLEQDNFNNISFNTKELTFDYPHNIKRIYQIYVTYRCTGDSGADMSYNLDGEEGSLPFETGRDGTNYNNSFNDTGGKWEVASLLFGSPINCYSIQLRLEGRAMPSDFEINDITFVYKIKNVKVKL